MIIIVHGSKNEQKQINNVEDVKELDNFSVNGFHVPMWVTSIGELDKHIEMLQVLKTKMSIA